MRKSLIFVAPLSALLSPLFSLTAQAADLPQPDHSVIDPRAMTLRVGSPYGLAINGQAFQFDALTSFNNYQYACYFVTEPENQKSPYHVALARRQLPSGPWKVIDLPDSPFVNGRDRNHIPWDAHNVVTIGICPADGSIHIAYDHHNNFLNYRHTDPGAATHPDTTDWSPALFHPRTDHLGPTQLKGVCYPMFLRTPDDGLQLFLRYGQSGNGSTFIHVYDPNAHTWAPQARQIDDGSHGLYTFNDVRHGNRPTTNPTRNAYPNGFNYGRDGRLHTSWTWREGPPHGNANHDICYIYSDDQGHSWHNSAGDLLQLPVNITSPGIIAVPLDQYTSVMNTQGQAVDHQGQPHLLMYHLDPSPNPKPTVWDPRHARYHHYWLDHADHTWHHTTLDPAQCDGPPGTRPRIIFDKNDTAYALYTNPAPGYPAYENPIYVPNGKLVIAAASKASGWSDWHTVATQPGPFVGEVLLDNQRLDTDGTLSVLLQKSPTANLQPTDLVVYDYATPAHE